MRFILCRRIQRAIKKVRLKTDQVDLGSLFTRSLIVICGDALQKTAKGAYIYDINEIIKTYMHTYDS
jgi:hypothetical protein